MKVIQPLNLNINDPIIFLAGPIQDAPEWHQIIIKSLTDKLGDKNVVIASPKILGEKPSDWTYQKQVDWETEYLNKAANKGIILCVVQIVHAKRILLRPFPGEFILK